MRRKKNKPGRRMDLSQQPGFLLRESRRLALVVLLFAWVSSLASSRAETRSMHEYELKAGVLYRILEYVEWPADSLSSNSPTIQIGLLGTFPYLQAIKVLNDKMVRGRKLVVKHLSGPAEAIDCQVLFIGASEEPQLSRIIGEIDGRPILTVGEVEGFAMNGGMINLVEGRNRIVMEVNREVADRARLSISSQLLKLAKILPR